MFKIVILKWLKLSIKYHNIYVIKIDYKQILKIMLSFKDISYEKEIYNIYIYIFS